jgi:hypothetical protein
MVTFIIFDTDANYASPQYSVLRDLHLCLPDGERPSSELKIFRPHYKALSIVGTVPGGHAGTPTAILINTDTTKEAVVGWRFWT